MDGTGFVNHMIGEKTTLVEHEQIFLKKIGEDAYIIQNQKCIFFLVELCGVHFV